MSRYDFAGRSFFWTTTVISQTAEYALRAIVFLAATGRPAVVQEIARATKVPAGYLSKVLQLLGRSAMVRSQRGPGGGFTLAVPPEKLTVLRVVNAVDPVRRIHVCPLGIASHGRSLCPLHARLDAAAATVESAFAGTTIAELLRDDGRSKPLCEVNVPTKRLKNP